MLANKFSVVTTLGRSVPALEHNLARYGLDYAAIRQVNPGIIYCSVTGFGQTGPYAPRPGTDSVFQAMSGMMSITGEPDQPPTKIGLIISDLIAGLYASNAIQAALRARDAADYSGYAETLLIMTQQHNMKEENILYPMCDQHLIYQLDELVPQLKREIAAEEGGE